MSAFSDYLEDLILGITMCGSHTGSNTIGIGLINTSTRWIGLVTSIVNGTEDRSSCMEPFYGNATSTNAAAYSRIAISCTSPTSPGGMVQNSGALTWTQAAAAWGAIAYVGVYDTNSPHLGNLLYYVTLTNTRQVDAGDTFQIPAGSFQLTLA